MLPDGQLATASCSVVECSLVLSLFSKAKLVAQFGSEDKPRLIVCILGRYHLLWRLGPLIRALNTEQEAVATWPLPQPQLLILMLSFANVATALTSCA